MTSKVKSHYSVTIPNALSLSTSTDVAATQKSLATAIADVKSIYSDLTTAKPAATTGGSTGGTVPAYLTAQISNYKLALARLSGSSSAGSGSAALSLLGG